MVAVAAVRSFATLHSAATWRCYERAGALGDPLQTALLGSAPAPSHCTRRGVGVALGDAALASKTGSNFGKITRDPNGVPRVECVA